MTGGTLDLHTHSITVASLSGTAGTITDNAATAGTSTLTVSQSTATSFAGILADGATRQLALSFSGGTLILSGNSDYSGVTNIDAGTLQLGSSNALGSTAGGTVVAAGAVLDLHGQSVGNESVSIIGLGTGDEARAVNTQLPSVASLSGAVTLSGDSGLGGSGDMALTGGISGPHSLKLLGNASLNSLTSPLASTVASIIDSKTGGAAFIAQSASLDLSGTMNGGLLYLDNSATTTLVGNLNAATSNVTLGGAVTGGASIVTADLLELIHAGTVEADVATDPLQIKVNNLVLDKSGGDTFLQQDAATHLTLTGSTAGNLTLIAGATTVAPTITSPAPTIAPPSNLTAAGGQLNVASLQVNAPVDIGTGSVMVSGATNFDIESSTSSPFTTPPTIKTGR